MEEAKLAEPVRPPRVALVTAVLVVLAVWHLVPFGRQLLYPFTLLATWVHELGHGLTAMVAGGSFHRLEIHADGSGLALTSYPPGAQVAVSLGGLLAPPVVGALILWLSRTPWRAKLVLTALALVLAASLLMWVRSLTGLIAVPLLAVLIAVVARLGDRVALFAAHLLGVLLALNTVTGIDYLFTDGAVVDGQRYDSDIANVADGLVGHYLIWGSLVATVSLLICAAGLWLAWRRSGDAPTGQRPDAGSGAGGSGAGAGQV